MIDPATRRSWRLAVARHRRLLAAACLAASVSAGIQALRPEDPRTTRVWVAAADLAAGHAVQPGDLTAASWASGSVPTGVTDPDTALGRRLATPLLRGEPLTQGRLVGPGLLEGQAPGTLAVAIRPAEPATIAMVRPGDLVDVLSASPGPGSDLGHSSGGIFEPTAGVSQPARIIARRILVLAIVSSMTTQASLFGSAGEQSDAAVVVAVNDETAIALASAVTEGPLTLALRKP